MKGFTAVLSVLLTCGFLLLILLGSASMSLAIRMNARHADLRSELRYAARACAEMLPLILASGKRGVEETIRLQGMDCEIEKAGEGVFLVQVESSGVAVAYRAELNEDFSTDSLIEVIATVE